MSNKESNTSYTQRVVYLKNGVRQGNPQLNARRCHAKAKSTGKPCMGFSIRGKLRCRLHGGRSTGAKTAVGKEKLCQIHLKTGLYSQEARLERKAIYRWLKIVIDIR